MGVSYGPRDDEGGAFFLVCVSFIMLSIVSCTLEVLGTRLLKGRMRHVDPRGRQKSHDEGSKGQVQEGGTSRDAPLAFPAHEKTC